MKLTTRGIFTTGNFDGFHCIGLKGKKGCIAAARPAVINMMLASPQLLASLEKMLAVYWADGDGKEPPKFIRDAQAAIAAAKA